MNKLLMMCALLTLTACLNQPVASTEDGFREKMNGGRVVRAAQAPDGTVLWAVKPPGTSRVVYFSSAGTQTEHSEGCGKNCTRTVDDDVPAARP